MGNAYRSVLAGGGAGTPITPSNISPANMEQGETYTPTANGKAVESVTDIMPSNSNPPALSAGNIYMPGSSGYAIGSYSNISPSSSGTYFSSGMKKMSSSGYAYSSRPSSLNNYTITLRTLVGNASVTHNAFITLPNSDGSIQSIKYNSRSNSNVIVTINGASHSLGDVVDVSASSSVDIRVRISTTYATDANATFIINPT